MADIKVLMVAEGDRFHFGPRQNTAGPEDDNNFSVSVVYSALQNSTTPSFQVDFAHRRGYTHAAGQPDSPEDCSANLTYPGDFVFALASPPAAHTVTTDLTQYDVLWLIGDEGFNGGVTLMTDQEITDPEKIAIAQFMAAGGGVLAIGDHDGIGADLCGKLPRVRAMRRWFEWDHPQTDPASGQAYTPNWSVSGFNAARPAQTDRNDTLRPDASDAQFYFFGQSDPTPQPVLDAAGAALAGGQVHTVLRDAEGAVVASFPDHMHEGEATDLTSVASPAFNPNQSAGHPWQVTYTDAQGHPVSFDEFPIADGYQPLPEVIAYGSDSGHATFYTPHTGVPDYVATNAKRGGIVSVYDGRAAGIGRVVTGSTFHHYLDKNVLGDPGTAPNTPSEQSQAGLPNAVVAGMQTFYVNVATWLARPNRNFTFLTVKNTFGADEVADAAAHNQSFSNAFYLVIDGYTPNQVGPMPVVAFSGSFYATGVNLQRGAPIPEDAGQPNATQRILIPFTVQTIPNASFPATGGAARVLVLEARVTIQGSPLSAEALFELVAGADPYFSNLGSSAADEWYLSQDLRVFQAGPGAPSTPFIAYPASGSAYDYITQLLDFLNRPANGYTDSTSDPFVTLSEANDLTELSSVTPNTQNFAVARVRLRGTAGTPASGVKVFFRMWESSSNDTDFDPQSTYVSTYDGSLLPDRPLPAPGGLNAPLFAGGRSGSSDYDPGVNQRDLVVGSSTVETWAYFGCFLDVYGNPGVSLAGTHHCLVAQIAYDGAPILGATGVTLSPENSDKLAQRNIQITPSGNPGGPPTHRVPQAFDLRPSLRTVLPITHALGHPDELMIDWGEVPRGSVASLYWPQAEAIDVVRLASMLYGTDLLRIGDRHTVQCRITSRLTYVPIPFGAGANLAGLFTIQLPQGVRKGQDFRVVVRRIGTRRVGDAVKPGAVFGAVAAKPQLSSRSGRLPDEIARLREGAPTARDWRYIVGTFQVAIPVGLDGALLRPEENALAILEWRLQHLSPSDRWHPVLKRYVGDVIGRVEGFGGDPGKIEPSPGGLPSPGGKSCHDVDVEELTGRICEVIYDCLGAFEGFVLETCGARRTFASRERDIGELALRACHERLTVTVVVARGSHVRIVRILVRAC